MGEIDTWARKQNDHPSRSEAVRRLLAFALADTRKHLSARNAPNGTKKATKPLTSFQIRAARGILGWSAEILARESSVSLRTIRRAELTDFHTKMTAPNDLSIRRVLEAAGVEFINENGGGPGVRLRKQQNKGPDSSVAR
jgi:hypothetical protein